MQRWRGGLFLPAQPGFKVFVAILFRMATIPVASHILTMIAHQKGVPHYRRDRDNKTR